MTTTALVHVVVSGLATGSIYALMAISLVIIYNATRTLNFAQGEMLMISTFVGWSAHEALRLPLPLVLLIAPVIFLSSKMGLVAINGFTAAVLGGFGSMPGAVVGGMLLGVLENLAPLWLPAGIKHSVPFLLMIAILVIRPSGVLGRVRQRKV